MQIHFTCPKQRPGVIFSDATPLASGGTKNKSGGNSLGRSKRNSACRIGDTKALILRILEL